MLFVCSVTVAERAQLMSLARKSGVESTFHVPGFVSDELLVAMYQSARLVWFPSIYEGFGLPVVEALACHTPVLCADSSSLVELLPDPAMRFDPLDVDAMAVVLEQGVRTPQDLNAAEYDGLVAPHTWEAVARRTDEVLQDLAERTRSRPTPRRRIAYITPWPPARSGVAGYSQRLVAALRSHVDVTVLSPTATPDAEFIEAFDALEADVRSAVRGRGWDIADA